VNRFPRSDKFLLISAMAAILVLVAGGAGAEDVRPATTYQLADWSEIWTFIDEYYIYPDFRGVDWKAQKAAVEARIKAGLDDAAFTALVDKTLALLKDPRTYYLSPEKLRSQLAISEGEGTTGVGLFLIKGKGNYAVVASVVPGGPADEAGIASHDRILAIDGKPPLDAYGEPDLYRVRGAPGSSLRLRVSRAGAAAREISLARRAVAPEGGAINGRMIEGSGNRRIGYIFLASMSLPGIGDLLRSEYARLSAAGKLDGLILDLRTTSGGLGEPILSCAGLFVEGPIGAIVDRAGEANPIAAVGGPVGNSREVPIVVLVSKVTRSGAEILAGVLRAMGRARLAGATTAGDTSVAAEMDLPGGGVIATAAAKFSPIGSADPGWLGKGIQPEVIVAGGSWDDFSGSEDPGIAKAAELLRSK